MGHTMVRFGNGIFTNGLFEMKGNYCFIASISTTIRGIGEENEKIVASNTCDTLLGIRNIHGASARSTRYI